MHLWSDDDMYSRRLYIVLIRYIYFACSPLCEFHDQIHLCNFDGNEKLSVFHSIIFVLVVFMGWCEEKIWNLEEILIPVVRWLIISWLHAPTCA